MGCPIRKSTDWLLCADTRSLSQLITSFFASESLGIPHTPLLSSSTLFNKDYISNMSKNSLPILDFVISNYSLLRLRG